MIYEANPYVKVKNCYIGEINGYGYAFVPGSKEGVVLLDHKTKTMLENLEIIKEDDFERFSLLLKNKLVRKKDDNASIKEYSFNKEKAKSLSVWLHISNRCNLDCPYCYITNKTDDIMSRKIADLFLKKLEYTIEKHGLKSIAIRFAGGEPTLNEDVLFSLVKELDKRFKKSDVSIKFILLTNGTKINKKLISLFKAFNVNICFSLDGIGKWHDVNRFFGKNTGSFEVIQKNLRWLKASGLKPTILTTITDENLHGIPTLNRYLVDSNFHFRYSLYRNNTGHSNAYKEFSDRVFNLLNSCYDYYIHAIINNDNKSKHQLCEINLNGKPNFRACNVGISGVTIDHTGEVFLCQAKMNENPIGNMSDDLTFLEMAWNQNTFLELKNKTVFDYNECKDCQWALVCSGGCSATSRDVYGNSAMASPYCSFFKKMIPRLIEIRAHQLLRKYLKFYSKRKEVIKNARA